MWICILSLLMASVLFVHGQTCCLNVELQPVFGERPLSFDTLALETAAGQRLSITRCDLLLSGAALQREDGTWLGAESWAAFISLRNGRDHFALNGIPTGRYTRLRFRIGLPENINRGDPTAYPAGHPLNPAVNGMHWGWQGGYVFAALEGMWRTPEGSISGYSFHLANEGNLMTVALPVDFDLTGDATLRLAVDAERFFAGLTLAGDNATTHSRAGDPVALLLHQNLEQAFRMESICPTPSREEAAVKVQAVIAPDATPYHFRFSSHFPRPALPLDNPLTEEGVMLGERLFHDTRLSGNCTQSCASCHEHREFFSDSRRYSIGAFGDPGTRQSMPLFNLAWKSAFFWDGRAATLHQQVQEPITNPKEMNAFLPVALGEIASGEHYSDMFEDAFGSPQVSLDRIARALEQYLLTLVSGDSRFDRAARGDGKLTELEQRGAVLFHTEYDPRRGQHGADCFHCHGGPLFQSVAFANNGLDRSPGDPGRYTVTGLEGDIGKFAVPSLRNIALTAPYMHDGRFQTLEEVIDHYDHGIQPSATLDPNLAKHPGEGMHLSEEDKTALVAFLKTLTDYEFLRPGLPPEPRSFAR